MSDPKPTGYMPILGTPFAVRMDLLSEEQAQANHWQSLSRLRERGGLSMCEAAAIAERRRWREQKVSEAAEAIARLAQPEQVAQDSPPQGYAMVSLKQLAQWNEWVSLLAAYHLKADRHNVARRFVESINTIRAARAPGGEVKP